MNYKIIIPALLAIAMTSTAAAQVSEISGTLTTGSSSNSSLTGTVTTTPGTGTLEGTVVSPESRGGGGSSGSSGSGGGGNGGGGSSTLIDMCSNIGGFQSIIPYGYVQDGAACLQTSVGGSTAGTPGIPNTGTGGNAIANLLSLIASGIILAIGSGFFLRRRA